MNKPTKKNKKYTYEQSIIKALVEKYKVTPVYIRQCLSGHSKSFTADKIKTDYFELEKKMNATLLIFNAKQGPT